MAKEISAERHNSQDCPQKNLKCFPSSHNNLMHHLKVMIIVFCTIFKRICMSLELILVLIYMLCGLYFGAAVVTLSFWSHPEIVNRNKRSLRSIQNKNEVTNRYDDCEADWMYFGNMGKCYKIYSNLLPWNEARSVCRQKSGELASVVDQETNKFLKNLGFSRSSWIGGSFEDETWTWSDGSEWRLNNWLGDNNSQTLENIKSALVIVHSDGKWISKMKNSTFPFICQK